MKKETVCTRVHDDKSRMAKMDVPDGIYNGTQTEAFEFVEAISTQWLNFMWGEKMTEERLKELLKKYEPENEMMFFYKDEE